jgi:hypothetical protein
MAKIALDLTAATTLHPREGIFLAGSLAAANAEVFVNADGANTVALIVSGTYVGTLTVEGSIDGVTYDTIPIKPVNAGGIYALTLASAAVGRWHGPVGPFRRVRVRMSAYTSGSAVVTLLAELGISDVTALLKASDSSVTVTAATGVIATLTLPAAGAGLFHYITRLIVQRHTSALLTAAATPILVTTTNLPGTRVLSFPADAAPQGVVATEIIEPTTPLRSSAANTATTVVGPATTGVIWRITADYYIAP